MVLSKGTATAHGIWRAAIIGCRPPTRQPDKAPVFPAIPQDAPGAGP